MIITNKLLRNLLLVAASTHAAIYPTSPDSTPPAQWSSMSSTFQQHCSPFGISIFAKDWDQDKFHHACNVLAQMLDNDLDGCADDNNVVYTMRKNQIVMAMFAKEDPGNYDMVPDNMTFQDLYASETEPSCSGSSETSNCRDAAIEEIMHIVTGSGVSPAYSSTYGECYSNSSKSTMQTHMDTARGGFFTSVPSSYPFNAIYHYDDTTCTYGCQSTEFFYWALTSYLNGQDARVADNMQEWEASTRSDLMNKASGMYNLFNSGTATSMVLLSPAGVLPGTGGLGAKYTYLPTSQTCANGCALDGTGCGTLGNSNVENINKCTGVVAPTPTPPTAPTPTPPVPTPPVPTPPVPTPTAPTPPTPCVNNSQFTFRLDNFAADRTCVWITKNLKKKDARIAKYCERSEIKAQCGDQCNSSCNDNNDPCTDDPTYVFSLKWNQGVQQNCAWITKNDKKTNARKATYCNDNSAVRAACRKTCSVCV